MNAEIKAAKRTLAPTKFNLWLAGYKAGRATGKAEGWLERQEEVWIKEKARHAKDGKFKAKKKTIKELNAIIDQVKSDAVELAYECLTRKRRRS